MELHSCLRITASTCSFPRPRKGLSLCYSPVHDGPTARSNGESKIFEARRSGFLVNTSHRTQVLKRQATNRSSKWRCKARSKRVISSLSNGEDEEPDSSTKDELEKENSEFLEKRRRRLQEAAAGDAFKDIVASASKRLQDYFDMNKVMVGNEEQNLSSGIENEFSWASWQRLFKDVEQREAILSTLKFHLEDAVDEENFEEAAQLKETISRIEEEDSMSQVFRKLQIALEEERYEDAAHLRDEAGAGLVGWWVGSALDTNDPFGRILNIMHLNGRLVGTTYSARQLATGGQGLPVFEIFVACDPKDGSYRQQAVYLKRELPPRIGVRDGPMEAISAKGSSSSSSSKGGRDPGGPSLPPPFSSPSSGKILDISSGDGDGSGAPSSKPLADENPLDPSSSSMALVNDGIQRVLGFFKERMPDVQVRMFQVSDGTLQQGDIPKLVEDLMKRMAAERQISSPDEADGGVDRGAETDLAEESDEEKDGRGTGDGSKATASSPEGEGDRVDKTGGAGSAGGAANYFKDAFQAFRFGMKVGKALAEGKDRGGAPTIRGDESADEDENGERGIPVRVVVGGVLQTSQGEVAGKVPERVPATIERKDRDNFVFRIEDESYQDLHNQEGFGKLEKSSEVKLASISTQASATLMPEEVAQFLWSVDKAPLKNLSADMADLIRLAVTHVQRRKQGLTPTTSFRRINTAQANSDPFSGLYVGAFGPHSSEAVQLQRRFGRWEVEAKASTARKEKKADTGRGGWRGTGVGEEDEEEEDVESPSIPSVKRSGSEEEEEKENGEKEGGAEEQGSGSETEGEGGKGESEEMVPPFEYVEAVKLTGDMNVPAGQVTFRAKIGREQRLPHRGVYPDELGVIARYPGQGRLADPGFQNPRWVSGELLVLDGKALGQTNGAEIGFVYSSGDRNFLVMFNRLRLQ